MPLAREQFIGLLPREFRAVNADGITMDQMRFDSPALHPYRRRPSGRGEPHPDLWQVHADPYRMNCIWLYDHEKREYIQADWTMAKQAVMPFSRETLALETTACNCDNLYCSRGRMAYANAIRMRWGLSESEESKP